MTSRHCRRLSLATTRFGLPESVHDIYQVADVPLCGVDALLGDGRVGRELPLVNDLVALMAARRPVCPPQLGLGVFFRQFNIGVADRPSFKAPDDEGLRVSQTLFECDNRFASLSGNI